LTVPRISPSPERLRATASQTDVEAHEMLGMSYTPDGTPWFVQDLPALPVLRIPSLSPTSHTTVDGHEMPESPSVPDGMVWTAHVVPPLVVRQIPSEATASQTVDEAHEMPETSYVSEDRLWSVHDFPPLVVPRMVPAEMPYPTASQSEAEKHEMSMSDVTDCG
jgi:hypothetical protein